MLVNLSNIRAAAAGSAVVPDAGARWLIGGGAAAAGSAVVPDAGARWRVGAGASIMSSLQ
jgi:hypothetical protein